MSDELVITNDGPEPSPAAQDGGRDYEAEIAKLRKEAAGYRTKYQEWKAKAEGFEPLAAKAQELEQAQLSEAEKMAKRVAELETALADKEAAFTAAERSHRFATLAAKAGVPADIAELIDISKFDLDDEAAALKSLEALAKMAKPQATVGPANPGRGQSGAVSDEEMRELIFGGKSRSIFD